MHRWNSNSRRMGVDLLDANIFDSWCREPEATRLPNHLGEEKIAIINMINPTRIPAKNIL